MKEYVMHVVVHKMNGNSFTDHVLVKANSLDDAKIEAINKAYALTNGQQMVEPLGTGYELQTGGGCRW